MPSSRDPFGHIGDYGIPRDDVPAHVRKQPRHARTRRPRKTSDITIDVALTVLGLLQAAFIALRVAGAVNWPWWVIAAPCYPVAAFLALGIFGFAMFAWTMNKYG